MDYSNPQSFHWRVGFDYLFVCGISNRRECRGEICRVNIKPIYNRLVVKRDPALTSSVIQIIEDKTKDRNELKPEGEVLAIGHDVHDVAVGNRVIFRKMSGTEVKVDGEDLLVMTEDDVIAVVS